MVEMKSDSIKEHATPTIEDDDRFLYFLEYLAEREVWPIERGCMLLLDEVSFRRFAVHEGVEYDCKVPPEHRYVRIRKRPAKPVAWACGFVGTWFDAGGG